MYARRLRRLLQTLHVAMLCVTCRQTWLSEPQLGSAGLLDPRSLAAVLLQLFREDAPVQA